MIIEVFTVDFRIRELYMFFKRLASVSERLGELREVAYLSSKKKVFSPSNFIWRSGRIRSQSAGADRNSDRQKKIILLVSSVKLTFSQVHSYLKLYVESNGIKFYLELV